MATDALAVRCLRPLGHSSEMRMWDYLAKTVTKDVNFNVNVNHHRRRKRELMPPPEHGFYSEKFADDVMFACPVLPLHYKSLSDLEGFEPPIRRPICNCLCSHWFTIPVKRLFLRGIQSGFVSGTQSLVIRCPHRCVTPYIYLSRSSVYRFTKSFGMMIFRAAMRSHSCFFHVIHLSFNSAY